MSRKTSLRVFLALIVALILAFFVVAIPAKMAHAQVKDAAVAQDTCGGYAAPAAAPPVTCYSDSVTVTTYGLDPAVCYDPDWNPLGYIMYYTTYSGWSYTDSNGAGYYGWWQSWEGSSGWQTVSGPAIVVNTSRSSDCGIPY